MDFAAPVRTAKLRYMRMVRYMMARYMRKKKVERAKKNARVCDCGVARWPLKPDSGDLPEPTKRRMNEKEKKTDGKVGEIEKKKEGPSEN